MAEYKFIRTFVVLATISTVSIVGGRNAARAAGAPTSLVVFGDSLSDMGNIASATGVVPGSSYYSDRFSNGPVWAERLAVDLGLSPLRASADGGNDFAYGGARTSGTSFFEGGLFIRDADDQIADYLRSRTVDPNALYVVWAGANDLFAGQTNVSIPVNRIAADLRQLMAAGARQFLVPNLPQLGKIPKYNKDATLSAQFNPITDQYNALFETTIDSLAAANLGATFYRLDVAEIFSDAIDHPADWGLTNVTDPAAPGLEPGAVFYNDENVVAHPEQYLFWDVIHPTAAIHSLLGDYANRLLAGLPGDFDTDGKVDAADLALLQRSFGAANAVRRQGDANGDGRVDGTDFLLWQRSAGQDVISQVKRAGVAAVPEPGAALLLVIGVFGACRLRRLFGGRN